MWAILVPILSQLAEWLFPILLIWIRTLLNALLKSVAAKQLLVDANPNTLEEFMPTYKRMLDVAINEMKPSWLQRICMNVARNKLLRPKVVATAWNTAISRGMVGVPVPDVSLAELLADAKMM